MECDWIGCHNGWEYKVYYDDVPIFFFCEKHYYPAIDFVLRDICPISNMDRKGKFKKGSVEEYRKDAFIASKESLLKREQKLKEAMKMKNESAFFRRKAKAEYERRREAFDEARKVLGL